MGRAALFLLILIPFAACRHPGNRIHLEGPWYKGNTHTHTLWSDGDAPPEVAADWYASHGYQFLVLSDHNTLSQEERWAEVDPVWKPGKVTPRMIEELVPRFGSTWVKERVFEGRRQMRLKTLPELKTHFESPERFLFIQGEEISDSFQEKPIHHNSINHVHRIAPTGGTTVRDVMERTLRAVEEEAARTGRPLLVHLNHPNFHWAVSPDDIAHVLGERYFEVYNGHPAVNNYGSATQMGMEQVWDHVLTLRLGPLGGDVLYGLATDDAHHYHSFAPGKPNPGRGWIMVQAPSLSADTITRAMLAGEFYASTGVSLKRIATTPADFTIDILPQPGVDYVTRFIGTRREGTGLGPAGALLQESQGPTARYPFRGDELYVRTTIISNRLHPNPYQTGDWETAWVQPVVPNRTGRK